MKNIKISKYVNIQLLKGHSEKPSAAPDMLVFKWRNRSLGFYWSLLKNTFSHYRIGREVIFVFCPSKTYCRHIVLWVTEMCCFDGKVTNISQVNDTNSKML